MAITFFASPAEFRAWLGEHHDRASELWVGFFKRATGRPTLTWQESVDEALCFGWIDGLRKRADEVSYTIRFTPRKSDSTWSAVNVARVEALIEQGRMQPAGLAAFEKRRGNRSGIYSYEQRRDVLEEPYGSILREDRAAWEFFQAQPPWYRKAAGWWVVSAKREETRLKRLAQLIEDSAHGRTIPPLSRTKSGK